MSYGMNPEAKILKDESERHQGAPHKQVGEKSNQKLWAKCYVRRTSNYVYLDKETTQSRDVINDVIMPGSRCLNKNARRESRALSLCNPNKIGCISQSQWTVRASDMIIQTGSWNEMGSKRKLNRNTMGSSSGRTWPLDAPMIITVATGKINGMVHAYNLK